MSSNVPVYHSNRTEETPDNRRCTTFTNEYTVNVYILPGIEEVDLSPVTDSVSGYRTHLRRVFVAVGEVTDHAADEPQPQPPSPAEHDPPPVSSFLESILVRLGTF